MKVAFHTLGCKVNQYESQIMAQQFSREGFCVVPPGCEAQIQVVNSCTVTAQSDKKSRQLLHRLRREHPGSVIVLTGCFPQAYPGEAAALPEADLVTGTLGRGALPGLVRQFLADGLRRVEIPSHQPGEAFEPMAATGHEQHTRAFVKIQDGCQRYCSYCIIPKARGPVRSKPPELIRRELEGLAARGYREAVLVGIDLPSYGRDLGLGFLDGVRAACQAPGISRVRLGSLEPDLLSARDLDELAALPAFCPQFHLSLQSGSDGVLRRMNRHYTVAEYLGLVRLIQQKFPAGAVTTDMMVGFPGETEEEFLQSLEFVRQAGFARVHVFAYSPRPGTPAAARPDQIPPPVKEERSRRMAEAAAEMRSAFLLRQVGSRQRVLFERYRPGAGAPGYTPNYTPVLVETPDDLRGMEYLVELTGVSGDGCTGRIIAAEQSEANASERGGQDGSI